MKKKIFALIICIATLLSALLAFSSCSNGKQTVMTVGEYKVSHDMLRYFVMNYMNGYDGVSPEDFASDEELQEQLYDNVIGSISELATYSLLAEKYGIKLTKDEKKEIKNTIKEYKNAYDSKSDFKKDMYANYMTEDLIEEIYTVQALCDKLYDYLTNEYTGIFKYDAETIDSDIAAGNFFSAEYVVIYYTEANKEERTAALQNILNKAKNGEKLKELADDGYVTYGQQLAYEHYPLFTYTEKTETFEETVRSLKINEYSDVVDMGNSAMIVRRLPLDSDYIDQNFNTVIAQYLSREFFGHVEEYSKGLEVKFKEKYKDLKMWEME